MDEVTELASGNNVVRYAYDGKRRVTRVELNGTEEYETYSYTEGETEETTVATNAKNETFTKVTAMLNPCNEWRSRRCSLSRLFPYAKRLSAGGIWLRFSDRVCIFAFSSFLSAPVPLLFVLPAPIQRPSRRGCFHPLSYGFGVSKILSKAFLRFPFGKLPWVTPLLCLYYSTEISFVNSFSEKTFNFL